MYKPTELTSLQTRLRPAPLAEDGTPALWTAHVAALGPEAARLARDVLDPTETAQAASFRREADRALYVTSHVTLRLLLAGHLNRTPQSVPLTRLTCPGCGEPHGRPAVAGSPLHFSLSHTGDLALVAVATVPVGADVEALPSPDTVDNVIRALHPREAAELRALPPREAPTAFTRTWTRKEAYLKGLGIGLARDPGLDYVGSGPTAAALPGWTITDVHAPTGYGAAVATATT
ncbi:4'-phosphopantetheinyl transferase family protein [Streptomyces sp. WMMC897]|uniref:4'-phosphopantetheinyl transferase family protein n=1 Tax=Streptomyces sp. WMMC897 TaxID=3014782 RepID=UPI0022B6AEFF|nr:4'-phosphopantetheinyl transferase superfamily protein [Streptomyces sp. WMMC897]MCZ7415200.1 4'-phosphopantetheinyl transferase superfamily protein [Streptomyces sp. WMMC897]